MIHGLLALGLVSGAQAQSWLRVSGIDTARGVYATAVHGGILYAATDTLVYRSADGVSWQPTASQPAPGVAAYYTLYAHATGLYAGGAGGVARRSIDGGQTWTAVGGGLPGEDVIALASLGDSLYAGLGFSGAYVLDLAGSGAWVPANAGLTQFGTNWIGEAGNHLFGALGAHLFVRARGAAQWSVVSWGDALQRQAFEVVAQDTFLFAATEAGVFRASLSDPTRWQRKDIEGMPGRTIPALAVQGHRVYAGLTQADQSWIWSTDNAGATWEVRAHEFAELYEMRLVGNRMWAARSDGLWYYDFGPVALKPRLPATSRRAAAPERRLDGRLRRRDERRFTEITLPRSP